MLEEILKSINSNLERMANAQEKTLAYMKEPIDITAEDVKDAVKVIGNAEVITSQQIAQTPIQQPIAEQIPQAPIQPTIPTTQVQESFTQEQLAVAMSNAVSAGKMNVIQGILQQFGVQALTQINPTDYNKVATLLKEAGVNV